MNKPIDDIFIYELVQQQKWVIHEWCAFAGKPEQITQLKTVSELEARQKLEISPK
jgi:hypothetical protein